MSTDARGPFADWPSKPFYPMCLNCNKVMAPLLKQPSESGYIGLARSTSIAIMDRTGYFCRLRCAAEYGVKAAKAGK